MSIEFYKKFVVLTTLIIRVINSVGSECYLDRVEVTGSNPV